MTHNETFQFATEHIDEDTDKLLLASKRYPNVDMRTAVMQIHARRAIKDKLPEWYCNPDIRYPSKLAAEQCSSEITSHYKATLAVGKTLCDLTGGLGVDTVAFSQVMESIDYFERFPEYCNAALHNFNVLQRRNIVIHNQDCRESIPNIVADTIYIDPARRGTMSQRLFSLNEYEPNILQIKDQLLAQSSRVIVKVSPMADIKAICSDFPEIFEIHIVSVKNECKELLLIAQNQQTPDLKIVTINFNSYNQTEKFEFFLNEENQLSSSFATDICKYIYEPNASIMKSGGFKTIAKKFNTLPIGKNSHLYTSDIHIPDFPGRGFKVKEVINFSSKWLKTAKQNYPKANITVRNFPLSVAEIRKRSQIGEGGEIYLFATTFQDKKIILECTKG